MLHAHLLNLPGLVPYADALALQRSLAEAVKAGERPDTVLLLEHEPVVTLGRRTQETELHLPAGVEVDVVETDRGGKSTYHGPGQLVCYPIVDLNRHGRDLHRVRPRPRGGDHPDARALRPRRTAHRRPHRRLARPAPPRKIASIGVHASRWVTTHGYALNVDLDPAPFTEWITACGLEDASFTTMAAELGRPLAVDDVRGAAAEAVSEVFSLALEELDAEAAEPPRPVAAR